MRRWDRPLGLALCALFGTAMVVACTLRVEMVVRSVPVAVVPSDAAVAVMPPASPGLARDAGPCGLLTDDPCAAATHYIDAGANVQPVTALAPTAVFHSVLAIVACLSGDN